MGPDNRSLVIAGILGALILSFCVSAQNGLVTYWSFDSVSNATYYDVTGHGYDAVKTGDLVAVSDGLVGKALECRGQAVDGVFNTFEIKVNNSIGTFALNRFSIECWIYSYVDLVNPGSFYNVRSIFEYATVGMEGSGTTGGYMIGINDNGKLYFSLGNNGWTSIATDSTLFPRRWYHIVATYDSSEIKLYLNGKLAKQTVNYNGYSIPNIAAIIGGEYQYTTGSDYRIRRLFNGKIDELKLYNYALDSQAIAVHYAAVKPVEQRPFKITLGMKTTYCKSGDTIVVPVMQTNFEKFSMSAIQFDLKIDPAKIALLDVSLDSGIVKDWQLSWNSGRADSIPVALAGLTTKLGYGQGELLRCKFLVKGSMPAGDTTTIYIKNVMVDEDVTHLITVSTLPGRVITKSPSHRCGDVDGNKMVDIDDARGILSAAVGRIKIPDTINHPDFTATVADVSGDGSISSFDAALVYQYYAGMLSEFPAEKNSNFAKKTSTALSALQAPIPDLSMMYVSSGPEGMVYQVTGKNLIGFVAGEFVIEYDPAVGGALNSVVTTVLRTSSLSAKIDQTTCKLKIAMIVIDQVSTSDPVVLATITLPPNATSVPLSVFQVKQALINEGNIPASIVPGTILSGFRNNAIKENIMENTVRYFGHRLLINNNCQPVVVSIHTLQGKLFKRQLFSKSAASTISIRTDNFPAGVYIYTIAIGNAAARAGRMAVAK